MTRSASRPSAAPSNSRALHEHADRLPPFQRPHGLHPIEVLPRIATGKLVRRRLRDLHLAFVTRERIEQHDP